MWSPDAVLRVPVSDAVALRVFLFGPADGTPVVLLHGFPEWAGAWREVAPALAAAGYRVIVPDQRGYGGSDAPRGAADYAIAALIADIATLLERLDASPAHVVGHDWGAAVAFGVAVAHPERVRTLTVTNGPYPPALKVAWGRSPRAALGSSYMALFQLPWLPERLMMALAPRLLAAMAPTGFSAATLGWYRREAWSSPGAFRGPLMWYRALRFGGFPRGRVTAPTRLVWGARDAIMSVAVARASATIAERAEVRVVDEAGHFLPAEAPQTLVSAVLDHLADHGGPVPYVFKIADAATWEAVDEAWRGAPVDEADGYIHLSAAHQVGGTLAKHFRDVAGLVLLTVDPARLPSGALRWEISRDGKPFPHLYGALPRAAVVAVRPI